MVLLQNLVESSLNQLSRLTDFLGILYLAMQKTSYHPLSEHISQSFDYYQLLAVTFGTC